MEIKRANRISNNYPKKEEITETVINENLLEKWYIAGISSLIIYGLLESSSYGFESQKAQLVGDMVVDENVFFENNTTVTNGLGLNQPQKDIRGGITDSACIVGILLVILILISIYSYSTKLKSDESKKKDEGKK